MKMMHDYRNTMQILALFNAAWYMTEIYAASQYNRAQ